VTIDQVSECKVLYLWVLTTAEPGVIKTFGAGKIDEATTQKIEAVMADIAGTYKA
jgi:F-type H+-transporting ATPase subunit alpha